MSKREQLPEEFDISISSHLSHYDEFKRVKIHKTETEMDPSTLWGFIKWMAFCGLMIWCGVGVESWPMIIFGIVWVFVGFWLVGQK